MPTNHTRRRREVELMELQARRRQEEAFRHSEDYYEDQWARPNNTMAPNEEVVEKRRSNHRKHVVMRFGRAQTRNLLGENIILLAALAFSIYGLYCLCLHILNQ